MKVNIIISPSQQTYNKCVVGDSEADHCRTIGEKVVELLKKYDCNVWLVPKIVGTESDILEKVANSSNYFVKTNKNDMSYHFELHSDAGYSATGASGFYFSEAGKAFIQKIHREVSAITPWADGICSLRDLHVLRKTDAIAGLLEISFHDRKNEANWINENIDNLAKAIVSGIAKATEIVLRKIDKIEDVDEAIKILEEHGLVNNVEFRKKVCDTVMWEADFVINVANYISQKIS